MTEQAEKVRSPLGELMHSRRKALGLTLEQASARAGFSLREWHEYEHAGREPKVTRLKVICAALGISLSRAVKVIAEDGGDGGGD